VIKCKTYRHRLSRSQISLCFNLFSEIDAHQIILFDFELTLYGVHEEGQLAAPLAVLLRGALHLPERELYADLRQDLTRFRAVARTALVELPILQKLQYECLVYNSILLLLGVGSNYCYFVLY
jgi:hypothetical protein